VKVAVIQHRLRATPAEDASALADAARAAAQRGADFVVLPEVPSLQGPGNLDRERLFQAVCELDGVRLVPQTGPNVAGIAFVSDPLEGVEELGRVALLIGDATLSGSSWLELLAKDPSVLVVCPRSENDLQAEAALELALAFSDSLAGLVLVAECDGAEPGDAGHGGSVIVLLGEVVAEALSGDDVLLAEVGVPVPQPEPREPLPELPTILQQRLANHRGEKPPVGYLADLSDGHSQR